MCFPSGQVASVHWVAIPSRVVFEQSLTLGKHTPGKHTRLQVRPRLRVGPPVFSNVQSQLCLRLGAVMAELILSKLVAGFCSCWRSPCCLAGGGGAGEAWGQRQTCRGWRPCRGPFSPSRELICAWGLPSQGQKRQRLVWPRRLPNPCGDMPSGVVGARLWNGGNRSLSGLGGRCSCRLDPP